MQPNHHRRLSSPRLAAAVLAAMAGVSALSGCVGVGDSMLSQAFVDPAAYDLYDCKQLSNERKGLAARLTQLEGLMKKAETGVGGAVVSEVAYRNDYIATKARARRAEDTWEDRKCTEDPPPAAPGAKPPANAKPTPGTKPAAAAAAH